MIDWTSVGVKPHPEAEEAVIGAILIEADKIMPECVAILDENDFLISEYRTLYRTMNAYFADGKPIDLVTMCAQHGDDYKLIMANAIQAVPVVSMWKQYAQIMIDTAKRYWAYQRVATLVESLSSGESVQDCQMLASEICESLSEAHHDSTMSAKEGFLKFYSSLQRPEEYIRTGFEKLDKYTYFCPGDFVVIGARPSKGKTALTLQMALHMSKSHRVVYFSLETRHNNLFGRMAANLSGIELSKIKMRTGFDFTQLAQTSKAFDSLNLHTVEAAGWSVTQIKAKAVQLGAEVIFIDYIGLIDAPGKSRYEKMTNISIDLHTLAQQSSITVFALSQLSRDGRGEPTLEHLRESGQIENDADAVLLLHAPDGVEEQSRKISIAKNKEGRIGWVELHFDGSIQKFHAINTFRDIERTDDMPW